MFKLNFKSICLSVLLLSTYSISPALQIAGHILSALTYDSTLQEAQFNIARQEAIKRAADVRVEADRLSEERAAFFAAILATAGYAVCNTGKFSYKILSDFNKTLLRLCQGKPEVWTGAFGLGILSSVILYNICKQRTRTRIPRRT